MDLGQRVEGREPFVGVRVGYIVGSVSESSINRRLAERLIAKAPASVELTEIPIRCLPLYNYDHDDSFPAAAVTFKQALESFDAVLFVTPEYNRSIPGALKNAIDWGSRPWGQNSFAGRTAAIIGTGLNSAGTAVAQSHLRSILVYLGMTVVGTPEVCIRWEPEALASDETDELLAAFWTTFADCLKSD
ncbi:NADPH-dependent FMN reductase [Microbacterium gorillae]|uniref:NADPH-dependent FMN reductase n=1 Tax=Microbacterium gorillae TaxID=1231063 RepID=UPI00069445D4|nr:NAD(P)H-dependent oxidoreductase [Microbacterium gorillae]